MVIELEKTQVLAQRNLADMERRTKELKTNAEKLEKEINDVCDQ